MFLFETRNNASCVLLLAFIKMDNPLFRDDGCNSTLYDVLECIEDSNCPISTKNVQNRRWCYVFTIYAVDFILFPYIREHKGIYFYMRSQNRYSKHLILFRLQNWKTVKFKPSRTDVFTTKTLQHMTLKWSTNDIDPMTDNLVK